MAPNVEIFVKPFSRSEFMVPPPRRLSTEGLQRAMSDLSFAMSKEEILDVEAATLPHPLPPIAEVEDAKCECCGMSEECTPDYIRRVREKYSGRWICGLCSEAVKEEVGKNGGREEEALEAHMSACARFNKFGRTHPVLYQAEAMREILRRNSKGVRAKSISPRDHKGGGGGGVIKKGGIARSSSCIPALTREIIQERADDKY